MKNISFILTILFTAMVFHVGAVPAHADDLEDDLFGSFDMQNVRGDFGTWSYLYSGAGSLDPAAFVDFTDFSEGYSQTLGVWTFMGGNPSVGANLTEAAQQYWSPNWTAPGRSVFPHPSPDRHAVVRWTNGLARTVNVQFEFKDMDDDCGDGVNWLVRKGSVDQATGSFGNGSGSGPQTLPPLSMGKGASLDFVVGPGAANDHGCDATELDIQITTPDPLPVIFANNSNGPMTLTKGTPISLDVSLTCASLKGQGIDYWALIRTPFPPPNDWLHYDHAARDWVPGMEPSFSGPCLNLNTFEILDMAGWPPGTYAGYFGFDTVMGDGLTPKNLVYDEVNVTYVK